MLKLNKRASFATLMLVMCFAIFAETGSNSPFTRYGFGNLIDPISTTSRAMGGTAYASRGYNVVNVMNPASYSGVDSLTFLFDVGATASMASYLEGGKSENYINGTLNNISMLFPVGKNMGVSFGIVPYSNAGYNFGSIDNTSAYVTNLYKGSGGISQVYLGTAISLFKNLSLGVNGMYQFGNIEHAYSPTFMDPTITSHTRVTYLSVQSFKFDIGAQYALKMAGDRELTLGAVFSPTGDFNGKSTTIMVGNTGTGGTTIDTTAVNNGGFSRPMNLGFGLNYKWKNKFTVAGDVQYQNWASQEFYSKKDTLNNRIRAAVGLEFIPKLYDRSYGKNIRYRAGLNWNQSYLQVDRNKVNELGMSLGVGLPLRNSRSMINFAFEYVHVNAPKTSYLTENYFKFTINLTVNEFWFFKTKFN